MEVDNRIFFAAVEERLREGEKVTIVLRGTSMHPILAEGDKVTLEPLRSDPLPGEVVLFRCGIHHVLHRVIATDGDTYTMQGDNCYGTETANRADIVARLVEVHRLDGKAFTTDSPEWQRQSTRALRRKKVRNTGLRWLGRRGRRQLRPWYFALLAILMWAPLNGLGLQLDNYILGLRADHLLHASVFLPMSLFLVDLFAKRRHWLGWLASCLVALIAEGGQYLLPYRGFDINDLVANIIGASIGWAALEIFFSRFSKK